MAWENFKVEQQRLQVVQTYLQGSSSMTTICVKYGISRKTGYKWYNRYLEYGEEELKDLSKAPHTSNQYYTDIQINKAIDLKCKYRTWGPKKFLIKLKEKYPDEDLPCATRLYEIFKEYHLVTSRQLRSRIPATAPLGNLLASNDTWAVDLKGWFLTGDGRKCEPLTITDCVTRYLIRCMHLNTHTVEDVWPVFDEAFREYGLPSRMRSDNGPPFGSTGVGRLTRLSVNLIKAGVIPEWIRPGHPEENGRHERFHLTLKQDTASPPKASLALQIQAMHEFQEEYNFERPHEALNMTTPGSNYQVSTKPWNGILRSPEYDTKEMEVRKVCSSGCIWYKQKEHYISQILKGEYLGLKHDENDELGLYYGPVYLGKLWNEGLEKPKIKARRQR